MSENRLMTCEQLDERLADWLEGDLDAGVRADVDRHVAGCARCAAVVADLGSIRREAASLPSLVPSRDLWPEIEARIQAPVISLDAPRTSVLRSRSPWWLGAAAAGLVAVTAGVTYYMTTRGQDQTSVIAANPAVVGLPSPQLLPEETEPDAPLTPDTEPARAPAPSAQSDVRSSAPSSRLVDVTAGSEYARDVAQLRAIVTQRRAELDSTTIAVLEKNLELIDRAIMESRAALQRDPASEFLADQLARAMTKKVAILRTAALLPARS